SAVSVHVVGPSEAQKKLVYPTQRSRVVPISLFRAINDCQVDMESFLNNIGFGSLYGINIEDLQVHDMLRIPVGGTILLSMEETEGDLDWLAQFGDLDPKKICATHIAEEIVKATNIDFINELDILGDWRVREFGGGVVRFVEEEIMESGAIKLLISNTFEFGKIAEMLGLPSEYGEKVKKCYNIYLDIVKCYYNTARVPKVCEKKASVMAEEGSWIKQAMLRTNKIRVGLERKARTEKESCRNTLRKLEHFGIKLEDSDDEGNKQQPSAKGTENVKLQKDYEVFKMKGLAAIEEGDQDDNTSTSSNDFFIIT
ncbi:hypothetical protein Tco_0903221, partial [Tanacetum coccineum]